MKTTRTAGDTTKATQRTMWECKQALLSEKEHSEEWHWARIGYNECARELGLPGFEE